MDTKKLRQKILDLAIRGKLVPQDPNDEPASVLLERIRAEKKRLIKEGKIKRSKKPASDTPHYENVPFVIPESWEWVRLSDIAYFGGGKTPSMDEKRYWENGSNLWVTSKDMKCNRISDSLMKISDHALAIMTQYNPGTLLMVTRSGILRHSLPIALLEKKATVNQDLKTISFYKGDIAEYIFYAIKANEKFILKEYHKDGTTVDSINFEKFANILLPLPPQNEQQRIIKSVHDWLDVVGTLETDKELFQSIIDNTRSKILELAIHGKLVPQDPNNEPAIDFLKRINPKFEPCDNAQYADQLPENWCWTTLGCLFEHNTGKALNKSDAHEGTLKPYLTTSNVYWNSFDFTEVKQMYFKDSELEKCTVTKGDLLVCEGGDIGRAAIWMYDYDICIQNHIHRLRAKGDVSQIFYMYVLMLYKWKDMIRGNGIGLQGLSSGLLDKLIVPFPPHKEQQRIVAKIEVNFAILDEINNSLKA